MRASISIGRWLALVAGLLLVALASINHTGPAAAQQPPPDETGRITYGSVPSDGGFGIIVYGGGTFGQLVTASGCAAPRVVFWVTTAGAFVVFIPASEVAAVNAPFQTIFPSGNIPPRTAMIGRCIPAPTGSGVEGLVTLGPVCPVVRDFAPCPDVPYSATLVILDSQGREVTRVTSGTDGRYRQALPAGRYTIVPLSPPGRPLPIASPVTFDVPPGAYVTVNIQYDSGIRTLQ